MGDFRCEFCGQPQNTLYEGWFRSPEAFNPFAQGTASAGLLQTRLACKECADKFRYVPDKTEQDDV